MALKKVVYLSSEDYNTLITDGSVTIDGTTITYSTDDIYLTPDNTAEKFAELQATVDELSTESSNKISKSSTPWLHISGYIVEATDIDTMLSKGSWGIQTSTLANQCTNLPINQDGSSPTAGLLEVSSPVCDEFDETTTSAYRLQKYTDVLGRVFIRAEIRNGEVHAGWNDWQQLL